MNKTLSMAAVITVLFLGVVGFAATKISPPMPDSVSADAGKTTGTERDRNTSNISGGETSAVHPASFASHDAQMMTEEEGRIWIVLQQMQWQSRLSQAAIADVIKGLKAQNDTVAQTALKVAALYRIKAVVPILEKGVGKSSSTRDAAKLILEAYKSGKGVVSFLRGKVLEDAADFEAERVYKHSVDSTRSVLRAIVITAEAKSLRSGKKKNPELATLKSTVFERELLLHSEKPSSEAVKDIIDRLSQIKLIGLKETQLNSVLQSYGKEQILDPIFTRLSVEQEPEATSELGKLILLQTLRLFVDGRLLDKDEVQRLQEVLSKLEKTDFQSVLDEIFWLKKRLISTQS